MMPYQGETVIVDTGDGFKLGKCVKPQPKSLKKYEYEPESLIEIYDQEEWYSHDNLYSGNNLEEHTDHDKSFEETENGVELHCHQCAEVIAEVETE